MDLTIQFIAWDRRIEGALDRAMQSAKGVHAVAGLYLRESNYFSSMACEKLPDWQSFDDWQDGAYREIDARIKSLPAVNTADLVVFLLDDVPRRLVPVLCKVWHDRVLAEPARNPADTAPLVRYQLAVLSASSTNKFLDGCADPAHLFAQLREIQSFNLEVPLLLSGPSGSGKTFFARFLHEMTTSPDARFEQVNLATFSQNADTLTSFLHGHVKGAFTGAVASRDGLFVRAQKGTVFFDELDGLSEPNQVQMLTLMEAAEPDGKLSIRRFGSEKSELVSRCNLMFATNRPIAIAIREQRLRKDFMYRCQTPLEFPSLRQSLREEGEPGRLIVYLLFHLMKFRPPLESWPGTLWNLRLPEALRNHQSDLYQDMLEFHWSGNLRTFQKYCRHLAGKFRFVGARRGLASFEGLIEDWLEWQHRQYREEAEAEAPATPVPVKVAFPRKPYREGEILEAYRQLILRAVELTRDAETRRPNLAKTAKLLGIDLRTLKSKIKDLGLEAKVKQPD